VRAPLHFLSCRARTAVLGRPCCAVSDDPGVLNSPEVKRGGGARSQAKQLTMAQAEARGAPLRRGDRGNYSSTTIRVLERLRTTSGPLSRASRCRASTPARHRQAHKSLPAVAPQPRRLPPASYSPYHTAWCRRTSPPAQPQLLAGRRAVCARRRFLHPPQVGNDVLYTRVFRSYRWPHPPRYAMEFFPKAERSRTGRLARPKRHACQGPIVALRQRGASRPGAVFIGYDKVMEVNSYFKN